MPRFERYTVSASVYDAISFERPVYRAGRLAGVAALRLRPGARVLVVGCGTGLDLPLLQDAIGPSGVVVGVDASAQMLRQAARRARRHGWGGVELVEADATTVTPEDLLRHLAAGTSDDRPGGAGADAVLFTYSLSLMHPWRAAWRTALAVARPGARVAVVDMAVPTGAARALAPLARLACAAGGADIEAHPWTALESALDDVSAVRLRGGHLQVRAGTVPARGRAAGLAPGTPETAHRVDGP